MRRARPRPRHPGRLPGQRQPGRRWPGSARPASWPPGPGCSTRAAGSAARRPSPRSGSACARCWSSRCSAPAAPRPGLFGLPARRRRRPAAAGGHRLRRRRLVPRRAVHDRRPRPALLRRAAPGAAPRRAARAVRVRRQRGAGCPDPPEGNAFPTDDELARLLDRAGFDLVQQVATAELAADPAVLDRTHRRVERAIADAHGDDPRFAQARDQEQRIGRLLADGPRHRPAAARRRPLTPSRVSGSRRIRASRVARRSPR